jgi:DNA-binding NtrC family response regulator
MVKKTILLITDDPKVESRIREILDGEIVVAADGGAAVALINKKTPDLIILDYDLKPVDGLQVFRQIHLLFPPLKVIMLSLANNIALAVEATKLGVADFLRKPLVADQLQAVVEANLAAEVPLLKFADIPWLRGESPLLKKMYADLAAAMLSRKNILLFGERGIDKKKIVEFIQANSFIKPRKLEIIDLSSFRRENLEPHFWATLQETLVESGAIEDRCGILYLEKVENLEKTFFSSLLEFFSQRKTEAQVVIGFFDKAAVAAPVLKNYALVEVPPLRERKIDLPFLLGHYLDIYARQHNKEVKGFSADALFALTAYNYPGNYRELECCLEESILLSSSPLLSAGDLPFAIKAMVEVSMKKNLAAGRFKPEAARRSFEKDLYRVLLSKNHDDLAATARFLDFPRTVLAERLEELGAEAAD